MTKKLGIKGKLKLDYIRRNDIMKRNDKGMKLIKNTIIIGMGSIASKAILFLMAPLFSRWLSVEEYGTFDLITTYVSLLLPICTLTIYEAVFRFLLDDLKNLNTKTIISSGITVIVGGYITFVCAYAIVSQSSRQIEFNAPMCFLLLAQMLYTYVSEMARGLKKLELYSLFSFIAVVLLAGGSTILLQIFDLGLKGIIYGYSLGYFIAAVGLFFSLHGFRFLSFKEIRWNEIKRMMKYAWPLIPNSLSWWIVNASDRLIINGFIGLTANGIYAVANKIPTIVNVFFSVFHTSWLQSASENVSDSDYSEYCNAVFNKLVQLLCSVVAVLICGNFIFYRVFFDMRYAEAYYYSPILIVAAAVSCIGQFAGGIMIAKMETRINGLTNLVAAVSNVILNIIMVQYFKLYAAAVSTLLAYFILVIVRLSTIKRYVTLKIRKSSMGAICITTGLFVGVYFNNFYLNVFLLCISIVFFFSMNSPLIFKIIKTLLQKRNCK